MGASNDLFNVIAGTDLRGCFSDDYRLWEEWVANPALKSRGYKVLGHWYTVDGDSFGPLVRGVMVEKDGEKKELTYG